MKFRLLADALGKEWKENSRVRLGVAFILLLLIVFLVLRVTEIAEFQISELEEKRVELLDIKMIEPADYWKKTLSQAEVRSNSAREILWSGPSESLVKVAAQTRLLSISKRVGIMNPQVSISEAQAIDDLPNIFKVTLPLEGLFKEGSFSELIAEMESGNNRFVIDKLRVATSADPERAGKVELVTEVIFSIEESS